MAKVDLASGASLFSRDSHNVLCSSCDWKDRGPCEHPPPPPPPPPDSQVACEELECPYDRAQQLCASLESHDISHENCLNDVCTSCDTNDMMIEAANQMVQNNLGGLGPDEGAEEIRFSKAAAINGQLVDLVIKQSGGNYQAGKPGTNGKTRSGAFGNINLKAKHDVD